MKDTQPAEAGGVVAPTYTATIYIAGELEVMRATCSDYCLRLGQCVSLTPTEYIFTGGTERGAAIGFINYPRFPAPKEQIERRAIELANLLLNDCCQRSCSVVCGDTTIYLTNPDITVGR